MQIMSFVVTGEKYLIKDGRTVADNYFKEALKTYEKTPKLRIILNGSIGIPNCFSANSCENFNLFFV